ncbi:glycosyltransferase family 4 protein [Candidatus Daviesbacteria bacterium]|nr:glycosyltransferase family 4 protein [Candidatus Daviesbacteria bacterium]
MKVAVVRGPGLSKWEMQIYEPLAKWFDLLGIGSKLPINDITGINFPITQLYCPSQYPTRIPKFIRFMMEATGDTQWLLGFDHAISGYDLLHCVETRNGYTLQAIRAKQRGLVKAVTLTVYENIPFVFDEYPKRRQIRQEVIQYADHFLAANEMAKQALIIEGADAKKISITPQSVDTGIFRPVVRSDNPSLAKLRKKYKFSRDDFIVLCVGRMVWEKGWYDIIPAALMMKKISKRVKFLFVGGGSETQKLKNFTVLAGASDVVVFAGPLPYTEVPILFRLADVFLYPSLPTKYWNAQFGGVLIEAMASGIPLVVTDCGGVFETIGKDGAIFTRPQDFSALVAALIKFMNYPSFRKKVGERNRNTALAKYDVDVVAKKIKNIWERIL